jgi:acetylornithine deacetylase/succinyl-diaminopimelate desuccinylase-like protein
MNTENTKKYVEEHFEELFINPLSEFIKVPNLTPSFDPEFLSNGLIQEALRCVKTHALGLGIEGLEFHSYEEEEGISPMVVIVYPGNGKQNIMLYGHLDKQPHMEGWSEGTGPTTPTIIGDKLYGRGSTDDGYVAFAVLLAVKNAIEQGVELPRLAIVLETEEESGSKNLVYLLDKCSKWIGTPDICLCCDSGALNYNKFWLTSTLRGMLGFNLKVSI